MFQDPTIIRILLGTIFIGLTASLVGTFSYLQKKSLIGDALSHAILPGVILAYGITGQRVTWMLMIGAIGAGWLASQQIEWILRKTKLKSDAALAAVMSTFFAFGLVALSYLQGNPDDGQAGLSDFLFGKIAALSLSDVQLFAGIAVIISVLIFWKFRTFTAIAFNKEFVQTRGFSVKGNDFLLTTLTILAITMGIQAVGVVLMSALLIIPVITARILVFRIIPLILVTAVIGVGSAVSGAVISIVAVDLPTGPLIITVLTLVSALVVGIRWIREHFNWRSNG